MIVGINGSGRKSGNCARLLDEALRGADSGRPGTSRTYRLADLTYRGCTGCLACRTGANSCVLDDDLVPVLEATAQADAVILASPIYYGYPSGLFKSYLDRWYSFRDAGRNLRTPSGRRALLILTQGHTDPDGYSWTVSSLEKVLAAYGFKPQVLVAAGLEAAADLAAQPEWVAEANRLGADLA